MRAIWNGHISFGLVTVPVKLYGATEKNDVAFHQVHQADGGRIKYERRCEVCGEVVEYADIVKAYDDGSQTLVMSKEELEGLPSAAKEEIEVVQFVPKEQIDPIMLDTPYYLEPEGKQPKPYVLLRETLENADKTAIVRFTLRSKTRLGVLRARGDVLVLQTLLWPDDVREADFPAASTSVKISDKEQQMADMLVDQYAGEFDPSAFTDDYQMELRALIDSKLEAGEGVATEATTGDAPEASGGKVLSLLDALEASLAKRKGGEAPAEDKAEEPAKKPAAKKKPTKAS